MALLAALLVWSLQAAGPEGAWRMYQRPEDAGFDPAAIRRITEYCHRSDIAALMVVYRGRVVWTTGDCQRRFQCHSIRKSLMNAVVGICYDSEILELDQTLADLRIDDVQGLTDVETRATVRQLLQARSGVYHPAVFETPSMTRARPKRGAHPPGSYWYYNNWDFNALATIVNQATGGDCLQMFRRRIAEPLGMEDFRDFDAHYFRDPAVSRHPGYGFKMSARDLARFGQLYLQRGIWNGRRILSERWIEASTRAYSDTHTTRGGYGYLWWIPDIVGAGRAYAACGVGTQVLLVLPEKDLIIVQRVNTYLGKAHPFDPKLVQMILEAKTGPGLPAPECPTWPNHRVDNDWAIAGGSHYIGTYRAFDGTYRIQVHGRGLMVEYPKGMRSLLQPQTTEDVFLVEDINELIRLEKPKPGENGVLHVLESIG